jgi:hypothetical protein
MGRLQAGPQLYVTPGGGWAAAAAPRQYYASMGHAIDPAERLAFSNFSLRTPKWGHSPKSWGNGGNIPLFPGLGECVGMGGMPILPLK